MLFGDGEYLTKKSRYNIVNMENLLWSLTVRTYASEV